MTDNSLRLVAQSLRLPVAPLAKDSVDQVVNALLSTVAEIQKQLDLLFPREQGRDQFIVGFDLSLSLYDELTEMQGLLISSSMVELQKLAGHAPIFLDELKKEQLLFLRRSIADVKELAADVDRFCTFIEGCERKYGVTLGTFKQNAKFALGEFRSFMRSHGNDPAQLERMAHHYNMVVDCIDQENTQLIELINSRVEQMVKANTEIVEASFPARNAVANELKSALLAVRAYRDEAESSESQSA